MSNSSNRIKDYETVHHITSRIAHKVRFLEDEDVRNDLVAMIRRTAEFTGVKLLGWCVMNNHFHILAFLPQPAVLDDDEVVRRYCVLKGKAAGKDLAQKVERLRLRGEKENDAADKCIEAICRRMYSISSFMKIVKQWFSEEYNRRNGHKGTLWEGAYYDRIVAYEQKEMEKCLGYIHLNPVRAAAAATYDGYAWSSYSAFKKGDPVAVAGMRFVYAENDELKNGPPLDVIASVHEAFLDVLLEDHKRRKAEEIARKRASGQNPPLDPLTTEALVVQAAAHMEEVSRAWVELHEAQRKAKSVKERYVTIEQQILLLVEASPGIKSEQIISGLGISKSSVYRHLARLKENGILISEGKGNGWSKYISGNQV